jgi:DNA-binding IclR family transcriptional regulator
MRRSETEPLSGAADSRLQDRQFVVSLGRGLQLLQAFKLGDDSVTNAELARRTGLPKPTVSRLTYTLTVLGFLSPNADGKGYHLHPHVLSLGYPVLAKLDVRQIARPLMQALADYSGGTVALGVRDGRDMIYIERSRDRTVVTLPLEIGSKMPIATTAIGRGYLAGLPDFERETLLEEVRSSGPEDWWLPMRQAIDREMERYRTHGYCFSAGHWDPDANAAGVPLVVDGVRMALSCGGPSSRVSHARLDDLGERLKELARNIIAGRGGAAHHDSRSDTNERQPEQ